MDEAIDRAALRDWIWSAIAELSEPLRVAVLGWRAEARGEGRLVSNTKST